MTELVREHDAGVKDGVAVVFVHGLEGNKRSSWTNSGANRDPWPQWLGQEVGCDTWTLGYDASLSTWCDFAGALHINGLSLMDKLATEPQLAGRPLILLAHDIGGLLVKKALVHAMTKAAPRHRRMVGRITSLGLIATPQSGAQLNTVAQAIAIARATVPTDKDFSADDTHLQELQREFRLLGDSLNAKVHVYAEAKQIVIGRKWLGLLKTRAIAVPYDAHASHSAGEVVVTLAEDHFSICQPKDKSAPLHQSVVALIEAAKTFSVATSEAAVPQADVAQPSPPAMQTQVEPIVVAVLQVPSPSQAAIAPAFEKPVASPREQVAAKAITIRPALLVGAQDERLQANESKLYGRDRELTRVLTFLDNGNERAAAVLPRGVDVGGTGKTELCKAALKLWIQRDSQRKVFFIALPDDADEAGLLHALATGIGLDDVSDAGTDIVFAAMPPGLYFIDNFGGVTLGDQWGQLVERLRNLPGVRVLVSSRHVSPADFEQSIEIDALPKQSALNLFRDLWSGSDVLPVDTALTQFIDGDLQRHAMSTALMARLGVFFGYDELQTRWRALRAANPTDHGLLTSMRLVSQALSTKTGALEMWRAVAQMPQGADAAQLLQAEADGRYPRGTAEFLQHHRIMHKVGNRFVMPMAAVQIGPSLDVGAGDA